MKKLYKNIQINLSLLEVEIKESISAEIKASYTGYEYSNGDLTLVFYNQLSPGAVVDLDNIIAAHDYTKTKPYFSIYDLFHSLDGVDIYSPPLEVDFTTQLVRKLHKKTLTKFRGKPTSVEYYQDYSNGMYSKITCRRDFVLTYDAAGFITKKIDMLKWYMSDGSLYPVGKDIGRIFDPILDMEARIKEGKARRGSIVDGLQLPVLAGLLETIAPLDGESFAQKQGRMVLLGRAFLQEHSQSFQDFINHSDKSIVTVMWNASETWLDMAVPSWGGYTIRGFILNELNI